jgi:hypothetical protein
MGAQGVSEYCIAFRQALGLAHIIPYITESNRPLEKPKTC